MKFLLATLIFAIGVACAVYSDNLIQKNPETIFLTTEGLESFQAFQKIAPEKKTLVVQVSYPNVVTLNDYSKFDKEIKNIEELCKEECELITQKTLSTSTKKFEKNFLSTEKKNILNLKSEKELSFVILQKNDSQKLKELIPFINNIEYFNSNGKSILMAGHPYTNHLLDEYSKSIKEKLFPIMFIFSFLIILLLTRNFLISLAIFLPGLFSSTMSLAVIKFFFLNMNMVSSIVPLMVFTINLSLGFHFYYSLVEFGSMRRVFTEKLFPISLMVLTTVIGFASLYISDIAVIKQFGILSSLLILLTTISTSLWFYSLEPLFIKFEKKHIRNVEVIPSFFKKSFSKSLIFAISLIGLFLGSYFGSKLDIITDATMYFPKSSQLKESIDKVSSDVAGLPVFDVLINLEREMNHKDIMNFSEVEKRLQPAIQSLSQNYKILSINSLVRNVNHSYSGQYEIPKHSLPYNILKNKIPSSLRESYSINSHYRITLLGKPINVDQYKKDLESLTSFFKKSLNSKFEFNGLYHNLMLSQEAMIGVLLKSFIISLAVICFISLIALKSFKIFYIFFLVNIIPVSISLLINYFIGLSLNIATIMTYSISLGLIVDSSFHMVHALKMKHFNFETYLRTTVRPILLSSTLFIFSFLLFSFNEFLPIRQFGINLSIIISIGLMFDLFVLPTLFLGHQHIEEAFNEK